MNDRRRPRDPKTGIASDFDVERFLDADRSTPTLLFAKPADPTEPIAPEQKPRVAYCPHLRYKVAGEARHPVRGVIVDDHAGRTSVIDPKAPREGVAADTGDFTTMKRVVVAMRAGLDATPRLIREERLSPAGK